MRSFIVLLLLIICSPVYASELVTWQLFSGPSEQPGSAALLISISPKNGSYHYAEQSKVGFKTEVTGTVANGSGVNSIKFISPKSVLKEHSNLSFVKVSRINDDKVKIYPEPVTFAALISSAEGQISFKVSGLMCSDKNCQPFKFEHSFELTSEEIKNLPSAKDSSWWDSFIKGSAISYVKLDSNNYFDISANSSKTNVSTKSSEQNLLGLLSEDSSVGSSLYSNVLDKLEPKYFNESLEVGALWEAILFGVIAGLLLNLMPCVLPVISLKLSSLLTISGMKKIENRKIIFRNYCLLFAAGILTWFIVLAFFIGGAEMVWGELFQSTSAILVVCLVLFLLGLSLFGVFSLPILDLRLNTGNNLYVQSYASGLLATLLATPCSGPLLGGVLSWTIHQSFPVIVTSISFVGVGMSLPYLVMAFFPDFVKVLPKPGAWTMRLEQLLGFFLMGSVVYFITLLPPNWLPVALLNLFLIAFAAWLWGQVGHLGASKRCRFFSKLSAILIVALGLFMGKGMLEESDIWEDFSATSFAELVGEEPLLLNFTADWCTSCIAMEHTTLIDRRMTRLKDKYNLRLIKVDLTRNADEEKKLLKALGSESIPLIAIFKTGKESENPLVLRDLITPIQLKDALKSEFSKR